MTGRAAIAATTGDAFQPQAILRYTVDDNVNVYASYGRGFRSGGFNQTGVATAADIGGLRQCRRHVQRRNRHHL
ncbi:MAG: TonB-dependent receptor [Rhizomicrobium sp.]